VTRFRGRAVVVRAVAACIAAAALTACRPPTESPAGLLVASGGALFRLSDAGALDPMKDAPANIRQVASAGRSVAALTRDDQVLGATVTSASADDLSWRGVDVTLPDWGFTAGIDVSPDGRSIALVQAHENADRLALLVIDRATGTATTRELEVGANGPPSWLGNDTLALEVVDAHGTAKVVSVAAPGGDADGAEPVESASRGLAIAATPDGRTIAVADGSAQVVDVIARADWWLGESGGAAVAPPSPDLVVQDAAIDSDATRVAVVYGHGDTPTWTIVVTTLVNGAWGRTVSVDLESEDPPTIDWLE
jgi:hypothetical protein